MTAKRRPPLASLAASRHERGGAGGEDEHASVTGLRVLVVSDSSLVGEAVGAALRAYGFDVVNVRGPEVEDDASEAPTVVVGLLMSELTPWSRLQTLRRLVSGGSLRWLVLTGTPVGPAWGGILQAGAAAVLPASTPGDEVARSLRRVALGDDLVGPDERAELVRRWRIHSVDTGRVRARLGGLTARERVVLELLYRGETVKSIAEAYAVSQSTVRSQVRSVLRKLDVNSQLAAVALWAEHRNEAPEDGGVRS